VELAARLASVERLDRSRSERLDAAAGPKSSIRHGRDRN